MCSYNNTLVHQVDMSLARALEMLADVLPVVSYMSESFLYPGLIHCCWTLYIMLLDLFITIQASSSLVAWTLCEPVRSWSWLMVWRGLELASGLWLENCHLPHILTALQWISRCVCLYSQNLLRFHFPIIHWNLLFVQDKWRSLIRATKTQLNELQLQGGGFTAPVKFSGLLWSVSFTHADIVGKGKH